MASRRGFHGRVRPALSRLRERARPRTLRLQEAPNCSTLNRQDNWIERVEILVPCYNHAKYLPDALESVLSQDCAIPPSVVIIDDRSGDESLRIALDYMSRLEANGNRTRVVSNISNRRQWWSLNAAVSSSDSELFVVLNDDDVLSPSALSIVTAALTDDPSLALVGGGSIWFESNPPPPQDFSCDEIGLFRFRPADTRRLRRPNDLNMTHSGMTFFRDAWAVAGGYRAPTERLVPGLNEDRDFQLRVCSHFNVGVLTCALAGWRTGSSHGKEF